MPSASLTFANLHDPILPLARAEPEVLVTGQTIAEATALVRQSVAVRMSEWAGTGYRRRASAPATHPPPIPRERPRQFVCLDGPPAAGRKRSELQAANLHAAQPGHLVPERLEEPANLAVPPFGQRQHKV